MAERDARTSIDAQGAWCAFPGCDVRASALVAGAPVCALHRTLLVEVAPPPPGEELRADSVVVDAGEADPPVADQLR